MAKRISTSIAEGIYELLQECANEERRFVSIHFGASSQGTLKASAKIVPTIR